MEFNPNDHSHRRLNILTGEWVQVSPHRSKRPWQGQVEKVVEEKRPEHDPSCYLCAGNKRIGGEVNPDYKDTYSFVNDFSALQADIPEGGKEDGLLVSKSEKGLCKVICFSPRHDLTIPELETASVKKVVDLWVNECEELGSKDFINHIQIFENKGAVMGCSNPHPHGQIWSQTSVPVEVAKKDSHMKGYFEKNNKSILSDYIAQELKEKERVIFENEHFVALVPFWAVWPYETMILPKRHMTKIGEMTEAEKEAFADAYRRLTIKYDNLFEISFPYSAGIHQAPYDGNEHPHWHWHMVFLPPLLRSATVKKFMVGYELLANPQRDITAEFSAERLRSLPDVHYKAK